MLEEGTEYILRITGQKRKRPNAPGTSKRQHFERANQKKKKLKKKDFSWGPSGTDDSRKVEPKSPVARRSEVGCQAEESLNRDIPKPHEEPPSQPPTPEEPLLSPRERKEQKKRAHQAKLEEQRRRNEEIRREEENLKQKRVEEANERRRIRQLKEEEEARIQTARKLEEDRWEEEWSQRFAEVSDRLEKAERKMWGWRRVYDGYSEYDLIQMKGSKRGREELAKVEHEMTEARLDTEEGKLALQRLKEEKQEEMKRRERRKKEERNERLCQEAGKADEEWVKEWNRR
jgi:hypothetical protein